MRKWRLAFILAFVGSGVLEVVARAETPAPWDVSTAWPPPAPAVAGRPEGSASLSPIIQVGTATDSPHPALLAREQTVNTELLLGLPTGLRVQRTITRQDNHSFLVEGFAGLYAILPMVGVGGRCSFTAWEDGHSALEIKPGIDAYLALNPLGALSGWGAGLVLGADVECIWLHECAKGSCWELGLDLGAGVLDRNRHGWAPLPIISVFTGLTF